MPKVLGSIRFILLCFTFIYAFVVVSILNTQKNTLNECAHFWVKIFMEMTWWVKLDFSIVKKNHREERCHNPNSSLSHATYGSTSFISQFPKLRSIKNGDEKAATFSIANDFEANILFCVAFNCLNHILFKLPTNLYSEYLLLYILIDVVSSPKKHVCSKKTLLNKK